MNGRAAERAVRLVRRAQSSPEAAAAARDIAADIAADDHGRAQLYFKHGARIVSALLSMMQTEPDLDLVDEYVYLLTALRHMMEMSGDSKHVANRLILKQTDELLKLFRRAYAKRPEGYTAPNLVSMWSSILTQEGEAECARYLAGVEDALSDCIRSRTEGAIVAILLTTNLNGHRDDTIRKVVPLFTVRIEGAFNAAFSGDEYFGRRWGPGPVTKCLSKLAGAPKVQDRIAASRSGLLEKVEKVLTFEKRDWPVSGFDDAYYMDAKGSACVVLAKLATRHDVLALRPTVKAALSTLLHNPEITPSVRAQARTALREVVHRHENGLAGGCAPGAGEPPGQQGVACA